MRIRHYWRKHLAEHAPMGARAMACDAAGTAAMLSKEPLEGLGWFLEVEPGTRAHDVCAETPVTKGMLLTFGGALIVDTDGPFLEIHPDKLVGPG